MNDLTPDEVMVLERIVAKPELQPYFFKKVKNLKWFHAIRDKGLLAPQLNPEPVNSEGDYWSVPSWPVAEYLVASSIKIQESNDLDHAEKYLALLKEVTCYAIDNEYSNYRTWWQFSKILRNLPLDNIGVDDLNIVSYWLGDRFDKHLISKEISEWVIDLVNNNDDHSRTLALYLLDALFTVNSIEGKYSNNKVEAALQLDGYQANEFVKNSANALGKKLGLEVVELFEKKLTEVLEINGNDRWSNIWRNAIAEHKQNSRNDDADDIVLKLFRDSLLGHFQSNLTEEANKKLIDVISSEYQTIKRIGIYAADECFDNIEEQVVDLVIDSNHFNDKYRHELWHFLNKHFDQLNEAQQASVIGSISALTVTNDKTGAIEDKPTAYKQANWYVAIKDMSAEANTHYLQCVDISGIEPDHPDFSCYTSGGAVVNESPLTVSELAAMLESPPELVKFLNEYEYVGHFGEPGLEGLVDTFGALVSLDNCFVLNNLEYFIDLKPHYLNEIFSSYSKLLSTKKQRLWAELWPKLLDFSHNLFQKNELWESPDNNESGPFIGDKHWVVSSYCRLVETGCDKDEHAFDLSLAETVKNTLELILGNESGEDFSNDSDAVSVAINSPRGRCLEAYFKLALYQCRNLEQDIEARQNIWLTYEQVFTDELNKPVTANEYEFITIVVMHIRNFLYLSKRWTNDNLEKMFGDDKSIQWLCAVQAYSYVGWLIPEIHSIFKAKGFYTSLLDDSNLSDTIKGRYIEYICISHIQKVDTLGDDDSLLQLLLRRNKENELSKVIWFLWSIRDQDIDMTKELVFALWPDLVQLTEQQTGERRPLASKLASWAEYIEELNDQNIPWLIAVAPYINDDYNGMSFMKELARFSEVHPLDVADIWKATLSKPFYMYELDPLETIFNNLISLGQEGCTVAREIADMYIIINDAAVVELYQRIIKG